MTTVLVLAGRDPAHPRAGGGDLQTWEWAGWLAAQGAHVHYVCQSARSLPSSETVAGVHVVRTTGGPLMPFRAWRIAHRLGGDVDLVYEDPIGAGRPPYFSPLWSRVPVLAVWYQVSGPLLTELFPRPLARVMTWLERLIARLYRRCTLWAPSEETAKAVVDELGFDPARMHVVYATSRPRDTTVRPMDTSRAHVIALGLFRPYKAFDHAIRALPAVLTEVPDAHLTIAGRRADHDYERSLHELTDRLGITDRVTFRTDLSEAEKHDLLAAADLLVLPSLLEGYGIVAIEANQAGIPVVASSGVPVAAVAHHLNGVRYEVGDIEGLAAAITTCLTDDELYAGLAARCREHAAGRTIGSMSPRFARAVDAALAQGSSFPVGRRPLTTSGRASAREGRWSRRGRRGGWRSAARRG